METLRTLQTVSSKWIRGKTRLDGRFPKQAIRFLSFCTTSLWTRRARKNSGTMLKHIQISCWGSWKDWGIHMIKISWATSFKRLAVTPTTTSATWNGLLLPPLLQQIRQREYNTGISHWLPNAKNCHQRTSAWWHLPSMKWSMKD